MNLKNNFGAIWGHMAACMLFGTGFMLLMFKTSVEHDDVNWSPMLFLAGAVVSTVLFLFKLVQMYQKWNVTGVTLNLKFGICVLSVIGGLYMVGATVDHFVFYKDKSKTGYSHVSLLDDKMQCTGEMLQVRLDKDTAVYRCPTSLVYGQIFLTPFVPWPGYEQGESLKLKDTLDLLHNATPEDSISFGANGELTIERKKSGSKDAQN